MSGPVVVVSSVGHPRRSPSAFFFSPSHETLEQRSLDIDSFGAQTHLAGIHENRIGQTDNRFFKIAVGKNDRGILPAQLKRNRFYIGRHRAHDRRPSAGFTRKRKPIDPGVRSQKLPAESGPNP